MATNPFVKALSDIPDNAFKHPTNIANAIPIDVITAAPANNDTASFPTKLNAVVMPINIKETAESTPTADHNLLVSNKVNTAIAPTKISIASAILINAFAFILKANERKTFPTPNIPLAKPETTSPIPSNTPKRDFTPSDIFFIKYINPAPMAIVKILPRLMLLIFSFIKVITLATFSLKPSKLRPLSSKFFFISSLNLVIASPTDLKLSPTSAKYFTTFSQKSFNASLILSRESLSISFTLLINSENTSIPFEKCLFRFSKVSVAASLIFEIFF